MIVLWLAVAATSIGLARLLCRLHRDGRDLMLIAGASAFASWFAGAIFVAIITFSISPPMFLKAVEDPNAISAMFALSFEKCFFAIILGPIATWLYKLDLDHRAKQATVKPVKKITF